MTAVRTIGEHSPLPSSETVSLYSNCDHDFYAGAVDELRSNPRAVGGHAAWDYHGYVWHADGLWHEQVWCYGSPVAEYECDDPEALIAHVVKEHGEG